MRYRRVLLLVAVFTVAGAPSALAQTEAPPDDGEATPTPTAEEQDLADEFQAELEDMLAEAGVEGGIPEITGEPGDLDLKPGDLVYSGVVVAVSSSEIPTGSGSTLTGPCQGLTMSFDSDGGVIDMAADFDDGGPPIDLIDGGQAFTASNPYEVDVDGYVAYAGTASPAPINHSWTIDVQGLTLDSGGDDNPDAEDRNAGTVNLADDLPAPAKVNGLIKVTGDMAADDGFACVGDGYVKLVGGLPVLGGIGLILLLCGGLGALFNARPAKTWKGA